MTIGQRLKNLRLERGWSQIHTAEQIGITRSAYHHYEANTRKPGRETLLKLADLFNVTTDHLLGKAELTVSAQLKAAQRQHRAEKEEIYQAIDSISQELAQLKKKLDRLVERS